MRRFIALLAWLLVAGPLGAADLSVVGSDLLGEKFSAGMMAFAKRAGLPLRLEFTGSRAGAETMQQGKADLALLVYAPDELPPGPPLVVRTVAWHTAVVVVPKTMPLEEISYRELQGIFGENQGLSLRRWSDLGVTGEWAGRPIVPVMGGPGGGLAGDLFRARLPVPRLLGVVHVEPDPTAALRRLGGKEGGIAILPMPPVQAEFKVLPVAAHPRDRAFLPTADNIFTGDYPLRLPLNVVFRADAARRLLPLLRFLYSEEAVALWQEAQLMALPPQARAGQVTEFEGM